MAVEKFISYYQDTSLKKGLIIIDKNTSKPLLIIMPQELNWNVGLMVSFLKKPHKSRKKGD